MDDAAAAATRAAAGAANVGATAGAAADTGADAPASTSVCGGGGSKPCRCGLRASMRTERLGPVSTTSSVLPLGGEGSPAPAPSSGA